MKQEKESLQHALDELEHIVEDLSKKNLDVETGLERFKKGVELVKQCRAQLEQSENEFKKLREELQASSSEDAGEDIPF